MKRFLKNLWWTGAYIVFVAWDVIQGDWWGAAFYAAFIPAIVLVYHSAEKWIAKRTPAPPATSPYTVPDVVHETASGDLLRCEVEDCKCKTPCEDPACRFLPGCGGSQNG